jgi:hypothetical protein
VLYTSSTEIGNKTPEKEMQQAEDRDVDFGWENLEMDQEAEEEREERRKLQERIAEPERFIAAVVAEVGAGGYLYENG